MPDLANGPITPEVNRWLGRACALVPKVDAFKADFASLGPACQGLGGPLQKMNAQIIASIVHQALAMAELDAPARVQGAFIAAGHTLDAYAAVGRVLGSAQSDVLMIDPYADEKAVTEYAVQAPETVTVRLLADETYYKPTLRPAMEKWAQQYGQTDVMRLCLE
jgi:hypothetical protein